MLVRGLNDTNRGGRLNRERTPLIHYSPNQSAQEAVLEHLINAVDMRAKQEAESRDRWRRHTDFGFELLDEIGGEALVDLEDDEGDAAGDGDDHHESHAVGALHLLL